MKISLNSSLRYYNNFQKKNQNINFSRSTNQKVSIEQIKKSIVGDLRDIVEYCDIYKQGSVYESALLLSEIINQKTIETGVPKDKTPTRNLAVARELLNEMLTATIGKKSYYFYGPFFYKNQFPKGKEEETYLILKDACEVIKYEYVDNPLLCRCAENFNRTDWFMKQDKKSKNASFGGVQKKF